MIIDFHTHIFADNIAPIAIPHLAKVGGVPAQHDGTAAGLLGAMDASGVDASVILPVATKPTQVDTINHWVISLNNKRLIPAGAMHPESINLEQQLDFLLDNGVRGIKLHPDYQSFFVDERRVYPLYNAVMERKMFIVFHAGVDIGLPPPVHCPPQRLAVVCRDFPCLCIIAAHMGAYAMPDEAIEYLLPTQVMIDTSFSSHADLQTVKRVAEAFGPRRMIFGSDSPWSRQEDEIQTVRDMGFSLKETGMILGGNAQKILNISEQ